VPNIAVDPAHPTGWVEPAPSLRRTLQVQVEKFSGDF